jgi:hypothetical protein
MLLMKKALFFTVAATLLACSSAPAQQAGSDVAARVGDRTITVKELDDRWRAADPAGHSEATQKLYDGRRNALDDMVAEMLVAEGHEPRRLRRG